MYDYYYKLEMQSKCRVKVQIVTKWSICAYVVNLGCAAALREPDLNNGYQV